MHRDPRRRHGHHDRDGGGHSDCAAAFAVTTAFRATPGRHRDVAIDFGIESIVGAVIAGSRCVGRAGRHTVVIGVVVVVGIRGGAHRDRF